MAGRAGVSIAVDTELARSRSNQMSRITSPSSAGAAANRSIAASLIAAHPDSC
jgi:hypothetical protein